MESAESSTKIRPRSRLKEYAVLVALIVAIAGGISAYGFYQTEVTLFFKLRAWDRKTPARIVVDFLSAAKRGDAEKADRLIDTSAYRPLKKGDRRVGYSLEVPTVGPVEYLFNDLAPAGEAKVDSVHFNYMGDGYAEAITSESVRYRLRMKDGKWTISQILSVPTPREK